MFNQDPTRKSETLDDVKLDNSLNSFEENDVLESDTAQEASDQAPTEQSPLEALEEEAAKMKDQWLRSVAEMENLRRRAQKDRDDAGKYAISSFARDLLSVSDNLSRALENVPSSEDLPDSLKALVSGIEMTQKELAASFERQSIVKVDPLNQKFDPNLHQAMFEIDNDEVEAGTILQVLQIGYTLHDRLLRPALVGVSKRTN